jgi:hypothetical protein
MRRDENGGAAQCPYLCKNTAIMESGTGEGRETPSKKRVL